QEIRTKTGTHRSSAPEPRRARSSRVSRVSLRAASKPATGTRRPFEGRVKRDVATVAVRAARRADRDCVGLDGCHAQLPLDGGTRDGGHSDHTPAIYGGRVLSSARANLRTLPCESGGTGRRAGLRIR